MVFWKNTCHLGRNLFWCLNSAFSSINPLVQNTKNCQFSQNLQLILPGSFNCHSSFQIGQRRNIYTDEALGMDTFLQKRGKMMEQFPFKEAERYFSKMSELLDNSGHSLMMVFKQDLDRVIYLCQSEEQMQLVKKMAVKFNQQNSNLRFGNFKFGPQLLRLCIVLDNPDLAVELTSEPALRCLFNDVGCYLMLSVLLYRHGLYSEVLDVAEQLGTGRLTSQRYPRSCVMTALAAALRMDSKAGQERGLALAHLAMASSRMPRRFYALSGALALQAGRPDVALTLLHNNGWPGHYTIRNIMVQAWCEMGELQQVLSLLRPLALDDSPGINTKQCSLFRKTYDCVAAAVSARGDAALLQEFRRVERALLDRGLLTDQDLLECVLLPFERSDTDTRRADPRHGDAFNAGSAKRYQKLSEFTASNRRREGLLDGVDLER